MIKIESTTKGFKIRNVEFTKTGKPISRIIGRAATMDEVDDLIQAFEDARS